MKLDRLVMTASSLLAVTFAHAAPTATSLDGEMNSSAAPQMLASADPNVGATPPSTSNMPSSTTDNTATSNSSSNSDSNQNSSSTDNSNDDMNADTATGDDDY